MSNTETERTKALRNIGPSSIVTVDNVPAEDVVSLKVYVDPVQSGSGDPSPTNVRPISGWTGAAVEVRGRNLLDPLGFKLSNANFGTIVSADRETGSIHFTYNPGDRYSGISIFTAGILTTKSLKPGKYICSFDIYGTITTTWSCGARRVRDNVFQGSRVISAPGHYSVQIDTSTWGAEDCYISWSRTGNQNTALDVTISNIILTPGTTEAAFEPYKSNQISVSFQNEAGTVYGGTLDVTTGLLTVTHKILELDGVTSGKKFIGKSSLTTADQYSLNTPDGWTFDAGSNRFVTDEEADAYGLRCSVGEYYSAWSGFGSKYCYTAYIERPRLQMRINFLKSMSVDTIKKANEWAAELYASGTPCQFIYPLATPQTYQLTPTQITLLAGVNNVWADCGDILKMRYWSYDLLLNKVVYDNNTLIDLTGDTITPEVMLAGYTAHDATGSEIEGSIEIATLSEVRSYFGLN